MVSDMTTPQPPPEADLIERHRKIQVPKLSVRKAASEAGISEGRWRQIALGYQSAGGMKIPVEAPAETIARMAYVVGLRAEDLTKVGRPDACDAMLALYAAPERIDIPPRTAEEAEYRDAADWDRGNEERAEALSAFSTLDLLGEVSNRIIRQQVRDREAAQHEATQPKQDERRTASGSSGGEVGRRGAPIGGVTDLPARPVEPDWENVGDLAARRVDPALRDPNQLHSDE